MMGIVMAFSTGSPSIAQQQMDPAVSDHATVMDTEYKNKQRFDHLVKSFSRKYGVDPKLVHAMIGVESQGNPKKITGRAYGLMQLTHEDFKTYGHGRNIFDPAANIDAGVNQLAFYLKKYNGDLQKSLAAYNWGPSKVDRLIQHGWNAYKLPKLTRNYIFTLLTKLDSVS